MGQAENSAIDLSSLLKIYFGDERVLSISECLREKKSVSAKGFSGSSASFIIRAVSEHRPGIHLVILQDKEQAAYVLNDLETLAVSLPSPAGEGSGVRFFPSSFKRPFTTEELGTPSIQLRAEVLNAIRQGSLTIISYPEAIAEKVISKEFLEKNSIDINKGEKISLQFLTDLLNEYGFERCDYVIEPGQYSVRGGIVDIFSFANDAPFRIELAGDEVESIRTFDTANQLSLQNFDKASILPNIQEKLAEGKSTSILDYILESKSNLFVWLDNENHILSTIDEGLKSVLEKDASTLFISSEELKSEFSNVPCIEFSSSPHSSRREIMGEVGFNFSPQPSFNKNFDLLFENLNKQNSNGYSNLILFDNPKQMERLRAIYESLFPATVEIAMRFPFGEDQGGIHEGFIDNDNKISCYTDHQIFGRYHRYKLKNSNFKKNEALTIKMLKSLQPGDYVTHIDYGIGRFGGMEKIVLPSPAGEGSGVRWQEAIRLVYKDNDTLHISIHSLHQIAKHSGKEGEAPRLDKLGSNAWTNLKRKTKKKVKEIAFDLIKLYAKRKAQKGFAFSPDNYLQNEIESSFLYEDTPDQVKSTADVKRDMEQEFPMDRLICGDVGFGKTEIAIRAAFKAVLDGKQTAVLVPTTILALQHYKTFAERMKGFPVTVDYINRFKSLKDQKETLKKLEAGKVDILIGTHRLLGKDIKFKDLGLLVVDEEQKFGVGAKDKLKTLKENVDTLTLTATPIPRTLQFSMMGARDLSVINTPPPNRYPIHTEVGQFNEKTIKEGIEYELQRGGQVFFVHNRVQNIGRYAELIQKLCPKARVLVAHGQLTGEALEKAMLNFIEGDYDVLVCTTIIESGLDIANANTIIVNDAQNYGLSDLYQLRGRVGRSNKKAFCYLLTPPFASLTNEAKKRLRAIEEFSDLGSGFNIAMRDLDIRGAGNLLGAEQSGFITDIGYEMYQKILDEAMQELREEVDGRQLAVGNETAGSRNLEDRNFVRDCTIDTDLEVLIPEEYVESISERIALYRQLDNSKTEDQLVAFEKHLQDRFGLVPNQVKKLISVVRLRWLAVELGFEKLILKNKKITAWFVSNQKSPYYQSKKFSQILQFVQSNPKTCSMNEGESKLTLKIENIKDIDTAVSILATIKK
ncbi:MAG: transcription-repair coupling factor [Bacteroidetes bacterium]|nr:MAG: transcription-repair coupling factor [Bacteroidota bacterium]